jgi:ferric-dicitrate binding protein FerR (iron transport regulator)
MDDQHIEQLLFTYFSGAAGSEEQKVILEWLAESEKHQARYREYSERWALQLLPDITKNKTAMHLRILNQLITRQERNDRRIWFTFRRIAAVLVLGAALGFASVWFLGKSLPDNSDGLYSTITVPNGSRSQLRLPDGSNVWLNAGSRLSYSDNFCKKERTVFLEGEALFEIQSDSLNPFRIKTGEIDAAVTGTVLTVRAYLDDPVVEVTLLEGKTKVEQLVNRQTTQLIPNQQLVYEKASGKITLQNVDAAKYAGWVKGKIYFADEPFEILAKQLERVYDIAIVIQAEKLKKERFYGSFDKSSGIQHIMKTIDVDRQYQWTFANETLFISNR